MRAIPALAIVVLLYSCSGNKEKQDKPVAAPQKDTLPYYDVYGFILREISAIKRIPEVQIYKITEQQGRKDSTVIDTVQFTELAAPFYSTNLNDPLTKTQYKETVFADNDTKSYVLDYKATSDALPVRSISVMLDNQRQDFKRADMVRSYKQHDTLYEERLAWIVGKKFQIIQIATAGNTELTRQTYVYWRGRN